MIGSAVQDVQGHIANIRPVISFSQLSRGASGAPRLSPVRRDRHEAAQLAIAAEAVAAEAVPAAAGYRTDGV